MNQLVEKEIDIEQIKDEIRKEVEAELLHSM